MQTRVLSSGVDLQDQYLVDFMHVAFLGRSTTSSRNLAFISWTQSQFSGANIVDDQ